MLLLWAASEAAEQDWGTGEVGAMCSDGRVGRSRCCRHPQHPACFPAAGPAQPLARPPVYRSSPRRGGFRVLYMSSWSWPHVADQICVLSQASNCPPVSSRLRWTISPIRPLALPDLHSSSCHARVRANSDLIYCCIYSGSAFLVKPWQKLTFKKKSIFLYKF